MGEKSFVPKRMLLMNNPIKNPGHLGDGGPRTEHC